MTHSLLKRGTAFFLSLVCPLVLGTALPEHGMQASADYENNHQNTGNQAEDLIAIAETQLGFFSPEDVRNKYTEWNGTIESFPDEGYGYAWCHAFVSWCANQAGISTEIIPRTAGTATGKEYFLNRYRFQYSNYHGGLYTPQRGDLVYFNWNGGAGNPNHVGIVTGVSGDTVDTIEGNSGNAVKRKQYSVYSYEIMGYGCPAYILNNVSGTETARITGNGITLPNDYHTPGRYFSAKGMVYSTYPIAQVRGGVYSKDWVGVKGACVTDSPTTVMHSYGIAALDNDLAFNTIPVGTYHYAWFVKDCMGNEQMVAHKEFTVGTAPENTGIWGENISMPRDNHPQGKYFIINGQVASTNPLSRIRGGVFTADGVGVTDAFVDYSPSDVIYSYDLHAFDNDILFDQIPAGTYVFQWQVYDANGNDEVVARKQFTVGSLISTTTDTTTSTTSTSTTTTTSTTMTTTTTSTTTTTTTTQPTNTVKNLKNVSGNAVAWTGSEDAVRYYLYIDGVKSTKTVNNSYAFQNLIAGRAYTIGVTAVSANGTESAMQTVKFTAKSMLTKPAGLKRGGATLRWNAVENAARYRVYVIDAKTLEIVTMNTKVTGTKYTFRTLTAGKRYKLRVCAVATDGTLGKSVTSATFTA